MELQELENKKSAMLAELSTEANCDYYSTNRTDMEAHLKECEECQRQLEIGKEYEQIQKQIKQKQGRTNAEPNGPGGKAARDPERTKWRKIAKSNGISTGLFYNRWKYGGLTYEQAATEPVRSRKDRWRRIGNEN